MKFVGAVSLVAGVVGNNSTLQQSWDSVQITHCGSGSSCGGHQRCSNYELALNDGPMWNSIVGQAMSGGYDSCPGGNWKDCCSGSHSGVCSNLPSCPLDSKSSTQYPLCVKSDSTGKQVTSYLTGCCPSRHPCNVCKTEQGDTGACNNFNNHADLCDNLWGALGYPSQSGTLTITNGACSSPTPSPSPSPSPSPCNDIAPDSQYSCSQQASWGKCSESWMKGYCCKTCFSCQSGCGQFETESDLDVTV